MPKCRSMKSSGDVTQDQLARELNLSKSTVSRILSGKFVFEDETRARVLALASKLGYRHLRPTVREHRGANGKVKLVGVFIEEEVLPDMPHFVPVVATRTLRGISEAARMDSTAIHVDYYTQEQINRLHLPEHQPALLRKGHLSGLLLHGDMDPATVEKLSHQLPCVRVSNREPEVAVDCVGQNDLDATGALVRHLVSLGHRRIGFLSESTSNWPYRARLAGYWMALADQQLEHRLDSVILPQRSAPSTPVQWDPLLGKVLAQVRNGIRAWICVHDDLGYRLARYLQSHGFQVPEDVAVCGFDNLEPPGENLPRMTTIDWPFEDIGAASMRRLLRRVLEPSSPQVYMMFEGRLIPGSSTTLKHLVSPGQSHPNQETVETTSESSTRRSTAKAGTIKNSDSRNST
jgi:LacI family transcriptional regulator